MQTSEIDQENVVGTAFGQESCARFMRNYGLDPKFQLDTQPGDLWYFRRYVILLFLPPEMNSKMIHLLPSKRALP